jgi:hypothetical protein
MTGNGNGTKAAVVAEIQAEAQAWQQWLTTLRDHAQAARRAHRWCTEGLAELGEIAGLTYDQAASHGDSSIPLETSEISPDHYTVQGLRELVLEANRARHEKVKQDIRAFILGRGMAGGYVTHDEVTAAFTALGLEMPQLRTRYDLRRIFLTWFEDGEGTTNPRELEPRILDAIRSVLPEGAKVNEPGPGRDIDGYVPEVTVTKQGSSYSGGGYHL